MIARKIESLEDAAFLLNDQLAGMEKMGGHLVNPVNLMSKMMQNQSVIMTALLLITREMALEKRAKTLEKKPSLS